MCARCCSGFWGHGSYLGEAHDFAVCFGLSTELRLLRFLPAAFESAFPRGVLPAGRTSVLFFTSFYFDFWGFPLTLRAQMAVYHLEENNLEKETKCFKMYKRLQSHLHGVWNYQRSKSSKAKTHPSLTKQGGPLQQRLLSSEGRRDL